ncbi:di-trans,poly-cis-decaprenylcistransferase [Candidatus Woesearchaeota archaeon]|nr:MAG: di-trans,poly-cis-decaprenylcistransferase [Candidatus Woesearchaeota archaeon]
MIDFNRILKQKAPVIKINRKNLPRHVGVTTNGTFQWAEKNNKTIEEAFRRKYENIRSIIKLQVKYQIPIMTIHVLPEGAKQEDALDALSSFLKAFSKDKFIHSNQIRVSVLGKWYDMPGIIIEDIKSVIDETKDYDKFFLNFCINYDGQEEIVDGCKLIVRKALLEKIDPETIDKSFLKENLYSSSFLPPEIILVYGLGNKLPDLLLWDSPNAYVFFKNKLWQDFSKEDFVNALIQFQRQGK